MGRFEIVSVRLHDMSFFIVCKLDIQYVDDFLFQVRIFHREENLYTSVQVSWHPVCAGHIGFLAAAVAEVEDAGMLQKISDNGTNLYVLADSRNTGLQTADTAHDQIDLYTGTACFIQGCDDTGVAKGIDLGMDKCLASVFGVADLALDQFIEAVAQPERSDGKFVPSLGLGVY